MIGTDKIKIFYVKFLVFYRLMFIKIIRHIIFKKHDYKKSTKILINRDGAFGDSIVAIPSISVIRQNFPSAQIDLLTFSDHGITFSDIELKDNLVNNILVKNKKNRFITLTNLKKNKYDLFIQLPQNLGLYKSLRNMIIVRFFIGIKSAFGWDSGRIKSFIKTQKKHLTIPTETQRLLNNLKSEGLMGKTSYPIEIKIHHEKTVIDLLKRKVAVFIIGGKLKIKKWPLKNWVNLANLIGEDYEIIIIGGPSEIEEAKYIKSRTKNSYNFCNKFSISELFFVFKNSQIAISNDTGAMHLCDAAGTIVIGYFQLKNSRLSGTLIIKKLL